MSDLQHIWQQHYAAVPARLAQVADFGRAVTAFNTNIDAVLPISGEQIAAWAAAFNLTAEEALNGPRQIVTPADVVRGILKCFILGIAEEWQMQDAAIYAWMHDNLGYERLQMGGQAGIIANVLAALGLPQVVAHTASLPALQATQFLDLPNLYGVADGKLVPATRINRAADTPLVHQIIEFAKDDRLTLAGQTYVCPRANRFIATYDPANAALQIDADFVRYINAHGYDYLLLSGFHNLTAVGGGLARIEAAADLLQKWRQKFPHGLIHLELASTPDKTIRAAVLQKIAPLADSLGLNEREALDALEVAAPEQFVQMRDKPLTAVMMWEALRILQQITGAPRLQLHMLGLYITWQHRDFVLAPTENLHSMLLAATVAAAKAGLGQINDVKSMLWAHGQDVCTVGLQALRNLAEYVKRPELLTDGVAEIGEFTVIAVPTILIERPKTLVGMGDTISSISLLGKR